MFGFLKGMFGTKKAVDVALDGVKNGIEGIGKCFFTDQEKAEWTLEAGKTWIEMQRAIADENSKRSITRRVLAIMFLAAFLLFLICCGVCYPINVAWAQVWLILAKQLSTPVLVVLTFYFGVHLVRGISTKK